MSKPIVIGNGSIVIESQQISETLESVLSEVMRERDLPLMRDHHLKWWASVGINHHRAEIAKLCDDQTFYVTAGASARIRYAVREGIALQADTLYIQQWLEYKYPAKRDLSMISYEHARKAGRELCVDEVAGTIVYKDSRLVTTFDSTAEARGASEEKMARVLPPHLQKMERTYDIRRVLTRGLAKYVGDLFKNCLRDSDQDYWKADSVIGKHLFIITEHNSMNVVGVFHTCSRTTDFLANKRYARTSSPLTMDNHDLEIKLPETFVLDGVTFVTSYDMYCEVTRTIRDRKKEPPKPDQYQDMLAALNRAQASFTAMAQEGGFRRGELMTFGAPGTGLRRTTGALYDGHAGEQEQPPMLDTEAGTDTMRRYLDAWRERMRPHQREAMERMNLEADRVIHFDIGNLGWAPGGNFQNINRVTRRRPQGEPFQLRIHFDYEMSFRDVEGRVLVVDSMSQVHNDPSAVPEWTDPNKPVTNKAQHVVERDANFFKRQKPAEKKTSGLLSKLTMRV